MKRAVFSGLTIATAVFLLIAPHASAIEHFEGLQGTYPEKVEPICRAYVEASEGLHKHPIFLTNEGRNRRAARIFASEGKDLKGTIDELEAVSPPESDRATFTTWFGYLNSVASLFERTSKVLKADNTAKAARLVKKLDRNATRADDTVASFEFHYCKLNPRAFG